MGVGGVTAVIRPIPLGRSVSADAGFGLTVSVDSVRSGFPSVPAASDHLLGWCDAPPVVQLKLVQLGIRTSLDLAGFFRFSRGCEGVVPSDSLRCTSGCSNSL